MGYAQKIEMIKTFGGVRFESDTVVYSPKQVLELMRDNPLAYEEFKKAKTNYGVAGALGAIGGFMVGFPLGTAIAGGEPEWGLAAGGAALIIASIPLNRAFKNHAQNALDIYNKGETARLKVRFDFTGTWARLVIRF
jgi:hypothetical protein